MKNDKIHNDGRITTPATKIAGCGLHWRVLAFVIPAFENLFQNFGGDLEFKPFPVD